MAYTPTEWTTGDTITATKLNNIEEGICDIPTPWLIEVDNPANSSCTLQASISQIISAMNTGRAVFLHFSYGTSSDPVEMHRLAPIVHVFRYGLSPQIWRVVVDYPKHFANIGSDATVFSPGALIFQASNNYTYPTYYKHVYPTTNTSETNANGIMD